MKRTERRHLKENEVERLVREARELAEAKQREITALLVAVVVIGGGFLGYYAWHSRTQSRAETMLAQAMAVEAARVAPPGAPGAPAPAGSFTTEQARAEAAVAKLKVAADAYPSTDAGIFARYQEGSLLMSLGRPADAIAAFQEVVKRAGDSIYGQMGKLGLAEAQARSGQYDQAIATFKDLAQRKDGSLPVDGILMQLGRTYLDAGKTADAQQTFSRLVDEYPDSPFSGEARQQLDTLKKS